MSRYNRGAMSVINLNKFRKKKAREEKVRKAAENRIRHGRTRAERVADAEENRLNARDVDGARRALLPPWQRFADIPPGDPAWHIGTGADYLRHWTAWLDALPKDESKHHLLGLRPVPSGWRALVAETYGALCEPGEQAADGDAHAIAALFDVGAPN